MVVYLRMEEGKGEVQMKKCEKEAIINKLLLVTALTIVASIILSLIYGGYIRTKYILAMPKIMIALSIVGIIGTIYFGFKVYKTKAFKNHQFVLLILSVILSISSVAIYYYNIYAIYVLYILIGLYLVVTFAYNIYRIRTK